MARMTRKEFLQGAAGMSAAAAGLAASPEALPASQRGVRRSTGRHRTLIRNAAVITMDDAVPDLELGDVLIEDARIAAVERTLSGVDAQVIDARGMILMPGMIDGHRHLWQDLGKGYVFSNYMRDGQLRYALGFRPEDFYLGNYIGGMTALDSGVTSVVDFCHILRNFEQADAAARGTKDSGVGGIFCAQLLAPPLSYGSGRQIDASLAWQQVMGPPDPALLTVLEKVRDRNFSASSDPLAFGVALTAAEFAKRSPEQVHVEFDYARRLEPKLITEHVLGTNGAWHMGLDKSYRLIPDLAQAGLIKPGYLIAHANGLSNAELKMLGDAGGATVSTPFGEVGYGQPSVHARAHALGVPSAIGADTTAWQTHDYFQHIRAAKSGLFRNAENAALAYKLSAREYLQFATIHGARALGIDSEVGSITPGKRADLVLLRTDRTLFPALGDPISRVFVHAGCADVDSVWVAGKLRKQGGKLINFDWTRAQRQCAQAWTRILAEGDKIEVTGELTGFPSLHGDD